MPDADTSAALLDQVRQARSNATPLRIQGANSKAFLGRCVSGEVLDTREHRGIVSYDPTELVITVRSGTPLAELETTLAAAGQMLSCEPPHLGAAATVGGMLGCGLSGPRRPWAGAVRDLVLGTRLITGHGHHLRFGGEVMKNVAGYDVSRLLVGSYGCLGVITEVSLKVLPRPRRSLSLRLEMEPATALQQLAVWGRQPIPLSAASHDGAALHLRLEGGEGSVAAAAERLGGEALDDNYWRQLREQQLAFFEDPRPLWRLSLPHSAALLELPGEQCIDWAGAQRWLKSPADAELIRECVGRIGGHATWFGTGVCDAPFQPLPDPMLHYHRQLKAQMDPQGIFNPGRMYAQV